MRTAAHRPIEDWLDQQAPGALHTTSVSVAEIMLGIEILPKGRRQTLLREVMEEILAGHFTGRIIPFDEPAARAYGRIVAEARSRGRLIQTADGQIAAIAKVHGLTVATRDTTPFEAAGVSVIDPWSL